MKNQLLADIQQEFVHGHTKKRHPFRYFTLATISNGVPKQRTVVLRKTGPAMSLVFFTDQRTAKIQDFHKNAAFSALFYHPKKLLQVRVEGTAALITDPKQIATYWHTVQSAARKDYTTEKAPGTLITNPDNVDYNADEHYFCPVQLRPTSIEYLRLKRPNHIRVLFSKVDEDWNGEFLVP